MKGISCFVISCVNNWIVYMACFPLLCFRSLLLPHAQVVVYT